MDIHQFTTACDTEEKCAARLAAARWPDGPVCDKCGSTGRAGKSIRPRYWHCRNCELMFSVTTGTPMEDTRLPLPKWFLAAFLIDRTPGIPITEISRSLDVGYKTAWFLTQRIRAAQDRSPTLLRGILDPDPLQSPVPRSGTGQNATQSRGKLAHP